MPRRRGRAGALLVGDARAVGRERGALDVLVDHVRPALADRALDQVGLAAGGQRGVEAVAVASEGDAPVVDVDGRDLLAAAEHGELLEVGDLGAGRHVDQRRLRREGPRVGVGVAGDEEGHRAVAAVGGDPRAARYAGDAERVAHLQVRAEDLGAVAGREAAAALQAQPAAAGEVDAVAVQAGEGLLVGLRGGRDHDLAAMRDAAEQDRRAVGRLRLGQGLGRAGRDGAVVLAAADPQCHGHGSSQYARPDEDSEEDSPPAPKNAPAPACGRTAPRPARSPPRAPRRSRRSRCAGPTGSTARRRRRRRAGGRCW